MNAFNIAWQLIAWGSLQYSCDGIAIETPLRNQLIKTMDQYDNTLIGFHKFHPDLTASTPGYSLDSRPIRLRAEMDRSKLIEYVAYMSHLRNLLEMDYDRFKSRPQNTLHSNAGTPLDELGDTSETVSSGREIIERCDQSMLSPVELTSLLKHLADQSIVNPIDTTGEKCCLCRSDNDSETNDTFYNYSNNTYLHSCLDSSWLNAEKPKVNCLCSSGELNRKISIFETLLKPQSKKKHKFNRLTSQFEEDNKCGQLGILNDLPPVGYGETSLIDCNRINQNDQELSDKMSEELLRRIQVVRYPKNTKNASKNRHRTGFRNFRLISNTPKDALHCGYLEIKDNCTPSCLPMKDPSEYVVVEALRHLQEMTHHQSPKEFEESPSLFKKCVGSRGNTRLNTQRFSTIPTQSSIDFVIENQLQNAEKCHIYNFPRVESLQGYSREDGSSLKSLYGQDYFGNRDNLDKIFFDQIPNEINPWNRPVESCFTVKVHRTSTVANKFSSSSSYIKDVTIQKA